MSMKQVMVARPLYKKNSERNPKNIVGIKLFWTDNTFRPLYSEPALIMWKSDYESVVLLGNSGKVYESQPINKTA